MIRRYELHLKTGVEDRIIVKTEGLPSSYSASADLRYRGSSPLVTGCPDVISEYPDCKDFFVSAFGSVRVRNRLVWIVCLTLQFEM